MWFCLLLDGIQSSWVCETAIVDYSFLIWGYFAYRKCSSCICLFSLWILMILMWRTIWWNLIQTLHAMTIITVSIWLFHFLDSKSFLFIIMSAKRTTYNNHFSDSFFEGTLCVKPALKAPFLMIYKVIHKQWEIYCFH